MLASLVIKPPAAAGAGRGLNTSPAILNDAIQLPPGGERLDIGGHLIGQIANRALTNPCDMRRDDKVRQIQSQQGMAFGRWLDTENVETGATDPARR